MRVYTIIGGVNGVGKSSFTGVLKERSTDFGIIVDVERSPLKWAQESLQVARKP